MSDPYHEHEDQMLLEEHAAHPERFHKYPNTMKQRFLNHVASIQNQRLREACSEILAIPGFLTWPASLSFHHAYEGGLLVHTVEVVDIAEGISISSAGIRAQRIDHDVLVAAALWHDVMKVRDYRNTTDTPKEETRALARKSTDFSPMTWWVSAPYAGEIHHIQGSAIAFNVAASKHGVSPDIIDPVTHCILAHHGRREWGSPVEPQTLEALILHQADMLSAKFGATKDTL